MKTRQLNHVLRAVDNITNSQHSFLLIGSQAILAHIDPDWFPELEEDDTLFVSTEIDVAVLDGDSRIQEAVADTIDGSMGALSRFDAEFGYHADGVVIQTAVLCDGWRDRLKPYQADDLRRGAFWALSYEDLIVSKLMAGREKDVDFVRGMCRAMPHYPGLSVVDDLIQSLPEKYDVMKIQALQRWRAMIPVWSKPSSFRP